MNREIYLNIAVVADFVSWASTYLSIWAKCHDVKSSSRSHAFRFDVVGIEQAYSKYTWKSSWVNSESEKTISSEDAQTTNKSLNILSSNLARTLNDPALHVKFCCSALDWGGVPSSRGFYLDNPQDTTEYHNVCHNQNKQGKLIPEMANDDICAQNKNMSSGITKVHSLLSISPVAPSNSVGLVIYDTRVAAAFNDLIARYCIDKNISKVPKPLLFSCGSARGNQRRTPNRLTHQKYPILSTQSPGNWTRDAMRVSWLLSAILQHEKCKVFVSLPLRERFLRSQMGLFMIGYDLNDNLDNIDSEEESDDKLTQDSRSLTTLGRGNKANTFVYHGSVIEGVDVIMGQGTKVNFPYQLFSDLLTNFNNRYDVFGGFNMTNPKIGGIGEWISINYPKYSARHGSFIAALLVNEGYCTHSYRGNSIVFDFR